MTGTHRLIIESNNRQDEAVSPEIWRQNFEVLMPSVVWKIPQIEGVGKWGKEDLNHGIKNLMKRGKKRLKLGKEIVRK